MADGTAQQCGRVGRCHIYLKNPCPKDKGFFVLNMFDSSACFILEFFPIEKGFSV
jgi:hypothetical protein